MVLCRKMQPGVCGATSKAIYFNFIDLQTLKTSLLEAWIPASVKLSELAVALLASVTYETCLRNRL